MAQPKQTNTGQMNGDTRQYSAIAQVPGEGFAYYLICKFSFQILRQYSDREGRFIIADIKTKTS